MTATILKLVPDDELSILETYIHKDTGTDLEAIYDALDVPEGSEDAPRGAIAVAQILLHRIQDELPSWGCTNDDGTPVLGRLPHQRHQDARLNFNPKHLLTINWADSGPGFSWPEAYYITFLPSFNQYIVTASRDGVDAYGCTDHAIGTADAHLSEFDAAKEILTRNWRKQFDEWDQPHWAHLISPGIVSGTAAYAWADEIWVSEDDEDDNDED